MLNVEGKVKIMGIEDKNEKAAKAKIYFGTKKGKDSEEWDSNFFNAVLVGEAFTKSYEIDEKEAIYITKGTVTNKSYVNKDGLNRAWLEVTIFDFLFGEEMGKHLEMIGQNNQKPTKGNNRRRR